MSFTKHLFIDVIVVPRVFTDAHRCQIYVNCWFHQMRDKSSIAYTNDSCIGFNLNNQPLQKAVRLHRIAPFKQNVTGIGAEIFLRRHYFPSPTINFGADFFNFHERVFLSGRFMPVALLKCSVICIRAISCGKIL